MRSPNATPFGFAGLDTFVSVIDLSSAPIISVASAAASRFPGTSPLPQTAPKPTTLAYRFGRWLRKKWDNMSRMEAIFGSIALGYFSLLFISSIHFHTEPSTKPIIPTQSPTPLAEPAQPKLRTVIAKHFYTLKSSEGNTFEIEGPANASAADLNRIAQSRWQSAQTYYPEEKPRINAGFTLTENEIRYCLAQEIRIGGWQKTVASDNHESVAAFNAQVGDYNSRCSRFKYIDGALQRVQAEVNSRYMSLDIDGRMHRGPRPPPSPPTFKKISSRIETVLTGNLHPRCKESPEVLKCEELEIRLKKESTSSPVKERAPAKTDLTPAELQAARDSVRTALFAASSHMDPPEPSFADSESKLRYLKWLDHAKGSLEKQQPDLKVRTEFLKIIWFESMRAGLEPSLVLGVVETVSNFHKFNVSASGTRGYMGINLIWVQLLADGDLSILFNTQINLRFGCVILRHYLDHRKGDLHLALQDYYESNQLLINGKQQPAANFSSLVWKNKVHWQ